jgi:S1-C subfamily serine protease
MAGGLALGSSTAEAAVASPVPVQATSVATLVVEESTNEAEAATALEAQIIATYDAASPAVVNITNRSFAYGRFGQTVPHEGTGSGFVYDAEGHIVTN